MSMLITADPIFIADLEDKNECSLPYSVYKDKRVIIPFDPIKYADTCNAFCTTVIDPMRQKPGPVTINIGQYFVFLISDLKTVFDASPEADFVQVYSRLDDRGFQKLIVVPYESAPEGDSTKGRKILKETTLLLEGLPCPPHPNCPKEVVKFE